MILFCIQILEAQNPVGPVPTFDNQADSTQEDSAKAKRVKILNANLLTFEKVDGVGIQKLIGNVQLQQDSTLFFCDRAFLYEDDNRIEAFEDVRVEMPDSVFLFGDRMEYDGNNKIAEVYDNITLTDQQSVLTTDRLTFYREEDYGYYQGGGKLVDGESVLTSEIGYYYPNEDMAYFRTDVVLDNPDYHLETDTLGYNTDTKEAFFLTLTHIKSKDGDIETTSGSYDTENSKVNLFERSTVKDSSYTLTSDSLYYIDEENIGLARGNVVVEQEDSSLQIRGDIGRFNRDTDRSLVTKNAVAIQFFDDDTLFIFADTLLSDKEIRLIPIKADTSGMDSLQVDSLGLDSMIVPEIVLDSATLDSMRRDSIITVPLPESDSLAEESTASIFDSTPDSAAYSFSPPQLVPKDTLPTYIALTDSLQLNQDSAGIGPPLPPPPPVPMDTLEIRVFKAYYNVRFFMNDMQGRADSLVYYYDDSLIYLFDDPVLWSEQNQISGDTIIIWMKNNQADSMWIGNDGFLVSQEDTVGFNQIKGKELRVKFQNNELNRIHVVGNSESIYFVKDNKDTVNNSYQGMNQALAQEMKMYFVENDVKKILFLTKPEGTFSPMFEVLFEENKLDGMRWRIQERPEKPNIFPAQEASSSEPTSLPPGPSGPIRPAGDLPAPNFSSPAEDKKNSEVQKDKDF